MKKRRKKRHFGLYTTGDLNRITDSFIHPFFNDRNTVILDFVAHALIERNLPESAGKFVKYSLPKLLKRPGKKRRRRVRSVRK